MADLHKVGARAWLVVALLWPVVALNYLDRQMISSLHGPIVQSIPMSEGDFGRLTAVFLWVYAGVSPAAGYITDRFGRSRIVVGSLAIWSGVTWLTAYAHSLHAMLIARGLMGVSEACYIPAALALIADYHPRDTRSLANGLHMSGLYVGVTLGGMAGYVAKCYDWRLAFVGCGVAGVVYAAFLAIFLRDAPLGNKTDTNTEPITIAYAMQALLGQWAFWLLMLATAAFGMANWIVNAWLPTYLEEHFSLDVGMAGLSATIYIQAASFLGVIFGGLWADRWSRTNLRARSLVPAIGLTVAAPSLSLVVSVDLLALAIVGLIVYGLGRGFFDANLMPVLRQVTDRRLSATGYSLLNVVSCASGGIMVEVAGHLKDAHVDLRYSYYLAAAGLVVGAAILYAIPPPKRNT